MGTQEKTRPAPTLAASAPSAGPAAAIPGAGGKTEPQIKHVAYLENSYKELQAQYQVRPLSADGKPYTFKAPPVDPDPGFSMTEAPQKAILALGTSGYFKLLARLMGSEAPAPSVWMFVVKAP